MTEKQEIILSTALRLFAENGYDATSTSKVAKEAGVSEGLIFRHFQNKDGLLNAIMANGMEKAETYFAAIMVISDPKERIKQSLLMPFSIDEDEFEFWKLTYALKWQRGYYDSSVFDSFINSLTESFEKLGYANPVAEARFIEVIIDGVATEILLKKKNPSPLLETILNKYELN